MHRKLINDVVKSILILLFDDITGYYIFTIFQDLNFTTFLDISVGNLHY